jgi:transposase
VPGRKTDVKDAEWIADLLRHGLMRPSYVPPPELRELRSLLRYRVKLVNARSAERNRIIKLLESANIKLSGIVSDLSIAKSPNLQKTLDFPAGSQYSRRGNEWFNCLYLGVLFRLQSAP